MGAKKLIYVNTFPTEYNTHEHRNVFFNSITINEFINCFCEIKI